MSWATWRAGQVAAPKLAAREALAVREVAATQPVAQS